MGRGEGDFMMRICKLSFTVSCLPRYLQAGRVYLGVRLKELDRLYRSMQELCRYCVRPAWEMQSVCQQVLAIWGFTLGIRIRRDTVFSLVFTTVGIQRVSIFRLLLVYC